MARDAVNIGSAWSCLVDITVDDRACLKERPAALVCGRRRVYNAYMSDAESRECHDQTSTGAKRAGRNGEPGPGLRRGAASHAREIFMAGLARVDPAAMVRGALRIEKKPGGAERLVVETELGRASFELGDFDRVIVTGAGKAGAAMSRGLEDALGARISDGLVAVKRGCAEKLDRIRLIESSHPLPDASSENASARILGLCQGLDERCLVIVLISGGGSALLCAPAQGLGLSDKTEVTKLLLASGAPIHEINCVRKHLSAVKGGRLAAACAPATVLTLILSDVIGDELDAIASGPTVPDPTSWADAADILRRRGIEERLPSAVASLLRRGLAGEIADTAKPGDLAFARTSSVLLGTNRLALMAAEARAKKLGYATLVLTSRLTGEAREAALFLLGIGRDMAAYGFPLKPPACLLVGGETTVTLRGEGRGGRNQEMALSFLAALSRQEGLRENEPRADGLAARVDRRLFFLAASTDGIDGPTDAAGAFASLDILAQARERGLDPEDFLANNDSYSFFERAGALFSIGPTGTNVCDMQLLLVE